MSRIINQVIKDNPPNQHIDRKVTFSPCSISYMHLHALISEIEVVLNLYAGQNNLQLLAKRYEVPENAIRRSLSSNGKNLITLLHLSNNEEVFLLESNWNWSIKSHTSES